MIMKSNMPGFRATRWAVNYTLSRGESDIEHALNGDEKAIERLSLLMPYFLDDPDVRRDGSIAYENTYVEKYAAAKKKFQRYLREIAG